MSRTTVDVSLRADVSQLLKELGSIEGVSKKEAKAMLKQFQKSYKDMEKASKIAADAQKKSLNKVGKDAEKQAGHVTDQYQRMATEIGSIFGIGLLGDLEGTFDIARQSSEKFGGTAQASFAMVAVGGAAALATTVALVTKLNQWVEDQKVLNREIASGAVAMEEFTSATFADSLANFASTIEMVDATSKRLANEGFLEAAQAATDLEFALLSIEATAGFGTKTLSNWLAAMTGGSEQQIELGKVLTERTKAIQQGNLALIENEGLLKKTQSATTGNLDPIERHAERQRLLVEEINKGIESTIAASQAQRRNLASDQQVTRELDEQLTALQERRTAVIESMEAERAAMVVTARAKKAAEEKAQSDKDAADRAKDRAKEDKEAAELAAAAGKAASLLAAQEAALATPMEKVNLAHEERVKNIRALLTEYPGLEDAERALELEAKRWASEQEQVNAALKKTEDQKTAESLAKLAEDTALAASVVNQLADAAAGFAALTLDKFTELADARTTAFEDQQSREAELHQARLERELERGDISQGQFDLEMTQLAAKQAAEAADFEALTEREQKAVKRAFGVQQAAAVSGVLMQGAQAYVAFLTAFSPLLLGAPAAAAGVVAPFVAAQLATIAAQKPPMEFPSGGMVSPDHMLIGAQRGEAVLSRRGVAAIGGPSAIDNINRGVAPQPANLVCNIVLDRRVLGKAIGKILPQSSQTVGRVAIFGGA